MSGIVRVDVRRDRDELVSPCEFSWEIGDSMNPQADLPDFVPVEDFLVGAELPPRHVRLRCARQRATGHG